MKNPYDKRLESQWTLGEWDEARLNRSKSRGERFGASLRFGGFIVGLSSLLVMFAMFAEMTKSPLGFFLLSGLSMSGFALGLALDRAGVGLEKRAERLSKVSDGDKSDKALARIQLALADSPRAKEWRDDAAWSGRELRMFDVEAMEVLAELEREANGAGAAQARPGRDRIEDGGVMRNPYDKRVERHWRLCGWDEARLNRSQNQAEQFGGSLRFGGFIVEFSSFFVMFAVPTEMTGGLLGWVVLLGLGMSVAALGFALEMAGDRLEKRAERLSKVSDGDKPDKALMRIQLALADSPRAKEWRDDAEWSGRELRMFDVEAMEVLAELEREANGGGAAQARPGRD